MLKLTKYELRKNLTGMCIIIGIIAVIQCFFMLSCLLGNKDNAALSSALLVLVATISFFIVFIFGVFSYSRELSSKSSYLIFMTPNSSLSIILSKLLYTLLWGIGIAAMLVVFALIDFKMLADLLDEELNYWELFKIFLSSTGIDILSIVYSIVSSVITFLASFFSMVTLAYLSITLTATVLQNKKIKGLISAVLFFVIVFIVTKIENIIPPLISEPDTYAEALIAVIPSTIFELAVMAACIAGCTILLNKKVSL